MATSSIESLVQGGQATAAPPLGPALGPLGVNIGQVVAEINKLTASFKGMQVPVKVIVDSETKKFEVTVGTPPASQLILKEAGLQKGSGRPNLEIIGDLRIEQVIKISKMKDTALLGATRKAKVKEVIGTCLSMGIMVEGVPAKETLKLVDEGKFDEVIAAEKTELTAEELKELEEERKKLQEELVAKRAQYEKTAKETITAMAGKTRNEIKKKLQELRVPEQIIEELLPAEEKKAEGAPGAAPAAAAKPAAKK